MEFRVMEPDAPRSPCFDATHASWSNCATTSYDSVQGKIGEKPTLTRSREGCWHPEPECLRKSINQPSWSAVWHAHMDRTGAAGPFLLSSKSSTRSATANAWNHFAPAFHERKTVLHTTLRRTGSAIVIALLGAGLAAVPAHATPGLFGSQDATYDGVYRQSLVIAGLRAAHVAVPRTAVAWLDAQQCADGGFQSLRTDLTQPCTLPDPANYVGEDTNSTAAAAFAFAALGDRARAARAVAYLRRAQNHDGGIPYYAGGDSDVNSTAMAMLGLRANRVAPAAVKRGGSSPLNYLVSAGVGCEGTSSTRGGLGYQVSKPNLPSDMATVQALAALSVKVPWMQHHRDLLRNTPQPQLRCPGSLPHDEATLRRVVAGYTARELATNHNLIPNSYGPGSDITSSAWAVIGLAGANLAGVQGTATDIAIRMAARSYVFDAKGQANAGRAGILLMVAVSRGDRPTSFGGMNLISIVLGTLGS